MYDGGGAVLSRFIHRSTSDNQTIWARERTTDAADAASRRHRVDVEAAHMHAHPYHTPLAHVRDRVQTHSALPHARVGLGHLPSGNTGRIRTVTGLAKTARIQAVGVQAWTQAPSGAERVSLRGDTSACASL